MGGNERAAVSRRAPCGQSSALPKGRAKAQPQQHSPVSVLSAPSGWETATGHRVSSAGSVLLHHLPFHI